MKETWSRLNNLPFYIGDYFYTILTRVKEEMVILKKMEN
jgi:hypothetical protein